MSEQPEIRNLNPGEDVRATANGLHQIRNNGALHNPAQTIDCLNSGTTARMLMGVCAGANLKARFDGDESLRRRPMEPVAAQLRAFGARIDTTDGTLPATIQGTAEPQTRRFILLSPSAQVKSALLFAGLYAGVPISITGDKGSRDHTERLLRYLGAGIEFDSQHVELREGKLKPKIIDVVGDFSSAAFLIVGATIAPGSALRITGVGINSTRTGLLDALDSMGAKVRLENQREISGEPVADIVVESAALRATTIGPPTSLRAIDEIPILAVAAAFAQGTTKITGVRDLRTKESDRIAAIRQLLTAAGISSEALPDGIVIHGGKPGASGIVVETRGDHRIAMSAAVLRTILGELAIDDESCCNVSYPGFLETLRTLQP